MYASQIVIKHNHFDKNGFLHMLPEQKKSF